MRSAVRKGFLGVKSALIDKEEATDMTDQFRQGDVLVTRIDALPMRSLEPRQRDATRGVVLAYGERTGHAHVVDALPEAVDFLEDASGNMFLVVRGEEGATKVLHEEHDPLDLPPGTYEVSQQREYEPGPAREAPVYRGD